MEFNQDKEFRPVSIILTTKKEAKDFFSIVDKVEVYNSSEVDLVLTKNENELLINLSNAVSNGVIIID